MEPAATRGRGPRGGAGLVALAPMPPVGGPALPLSATTGHHPVNYHCSIRQEVGLDDYEVRSAAAGLGPARDACAMSPGPAGRGVGGGSGTSRDSATRSSWASSNTSMPTCPRTSRSTSSSTTTAPTSTPALSAGYPATLSSPLHPHLRLLAQPGRDLVPPHHAEGHPPRLLLFRHPTQGEDPPLHRPLQPRHPTLPVDRDCRLHPPQDAEIMHVYFWDRMLICRDMTKKPLWRQHCYLHRLASVDARS